MDNLYTNYLLNHVVPAMHRRDKIMGMKYTYAEFKEQYPDDDACLDAIFQSQFGDLKFCPKCGAETTFYRIKKRQCYSCRWCRHQIYPLVGTIFQKTTTPLTSWFHAIYLFSVSKNGVSAAELERHLGVGYKTAWRMAKQIRLLMKQDTEKLIGTVEMDETYVGGKYIGRRHHHMKYDKKEIVFGMIERHGSVKAKRVKSNGARVLLPEVAEHVHPDSKVYTDSWNAYDRLPKFGYTRTSVNHRRLEYVRGDVHTNTIEGFWSQLKRSLQGTYHAVSPKYLQLYLDEFCFRYNFRDVAIGPILLELAAKKT